MISVAVVEKIMYCRSFVFNVRWNSRFLGIFFYVLQKPNICSKGSSPSILPLLPSTVWLSISICLKKVLIKSTAVFPSLLLSKWDNYSPLLPVKDLIKVEICPKKLTCSISMPPVVASEASLKQWAQGLFINLNWLVLSKLAAGILTVISNSK